MIVWGAKSEVANTGPQASRHCPTCEKERPFHLVLQYTVRHIWYVFKWVTGKQYATVCESASAGTSWTPRRWSPTLSKPPIPFGTRWGWAFLAGMIAIAAVFGFMDDSSRSKSREAYLAAPRKGDLYVVNVASILTAPQSKYLYGVLRVRAANADSIEFDAPSFFYSGSSGPTKDIRDGKLDQPGYFHAGTDHSVPQRDRAHPQGTRHPSIDRGPQASLARAP
jgi:hypothetical protein